MPFLASPAPGKDRTTVSRWPPQQRVRKALVDLKPCNALLSAQDVAPKKHTPAYLAGDEAGIGEAYAARDKEKAVVRQRRLSRGAAGRYAGAEGVRTSRVLGLKRVTVRQVPQRRSSDEAPERFDTKESGRGGRVSAKLEARAGTPRSSCGPGGRGPCGKLVPGLVAGEDGVILLAEGKFCSPSDSEGVNAEESEEDHFPAVALTSSPEFVRKLKGSPAGRGCFAAGPLVGSGGNGGSVVRDRRKCKPRGVLIVGEERSVPGSPDDGKGEWNEKVPKRSAASVEWMVDDEAPNWSSISEVHTSAVDMSGSFGISCDAMSIPQGSGSNNPRESFPRIYEEGWMELRTMKCSVAMGEADADELQLAHEEADWLEYQKHVQLQRKDHTSFLAAGGLNIHQQQEDQTGIADGVSAKRIPGSVLQEPHILGQPGSPSSDDEDSLAPLQCCSPQVKGKHVGRRTKLGTDSEGDLVMGAAESIKPSDHAGMSMSSPRSKGEALEADLGHRAWPSRRNLASDSASSRNGLGIVDRYRQNAMVELPERSLLTYVVPTNSPESEGKVLAAQNSKQLLETGNSTVVRTPVKVEGTRYSKGEGQGIPLSYHPPSRYGAIEAAPCASTESRLQTILPHTAGSVGFTAESAGLHDLYGTEAHDNLSSAVLRKIKICKEQDLARTLEAISQRSVATDNSIGIGQRMSPVHPRVPLRNRVRSLSGLLNSQEVRDELRSEDNLKLFKKKYPRRQQGQDIPRVVEPDNTLLFKPRPTPHTLVGPVGEATQETDPGVLSSSTTAGVEPAWKAFRIAQCRMKIKPRRHPRLAVYRGATQDRDSRVSPG